MLSVGGKILVVLYEQVISSHMVSVPYNAHEHI